MTRPSFLLSRAGLAVAILSCFLLAPAALRAQGDAHEMSELESIPRFSSPSSAARLIQGSYPSALKRAGINGTVQLEFVVLPNGKVEAGSVQVVTASSPALGEAAKGMAEKIEFTPGTIKGEAVRARVILPLVYKAN
jgi:TonB family protein